MLNRKNGTLVRRLKSESNEPFNFVPRVQGGGGSVSVWGCISGGARGSLVVYSGRVNGPSYINIIQEYLTLLKVHSVKQIPTGSSCKTMHRLINRNMR